MFKHLIIPAALALALMVAVPATASAQHAGIHVGGKNFHVGVQLGRPVYRPRPVVVCEPPPAGRYELVTRRVWREGYTRVVHVPAEYVTRYDHCGRPYQVCVRPAYDDRVVVPGCWETVSERVWVPGYGHGHRRGHGRWH
jgi:hypothetical protein